MLDTDPDTMIALRQFQAVTSKTKETFMPFVRPHPQSKALEQAQDLMPGTKHSINRQLAKQAGQMAYLDLSGETERAKNQRL